jgi:hypothetical protein
MATTPSQQDFICKVTEEGYLLVMSKNLKPDSKPTKDLHLDFFG